MGCAMGRSGTRQSLSRMPYSGSQYVHKHVIQLVCDLIVARLLVAGRVAVHLDHTDGALLHAEQ
eukprot:16428476-Heterocapsa_arctica.AAC.1